MDSLSFAVPASTPRRTRPKFGRLILVLLFVNTFFLQANARPLSVQAQDSSTIETTQSPVSYLAVKENAPAPFIYAHNYLLMDADNGEVVIGKNISQSVPVASTTKMVTAIVARELFDLDEVVTVKRLASGINGSKINLFYQEKITVHNLLRGLLIQSGNDTAFALAEHYGQKDGDYQSFVEKMNEYAAQHNLTDTVFGDPAGLDDDTGRSTARDLAHIARLLLADPVLAKIVDTPEMTVYSTNRQLRHDLLNSNRLVLNDSPYYLRGAIGVKTGFTHDAGHCLVSAYESTQGRLIGVVLNTVEYTITASAAESRKLFLWANSNIERRDY